MNILIVEDEISKEKSIKNFILEILPTANITTSNSITTAIIEIGGSDFNYIILDMSLPLYDLNDMNHSEDNEFEALGGTFVLDEIDRLGRKCQVIVVTAFDVIGEGERQIELSQIKEELKEEYPLNYIDTIFYNTSGFEWKNQLKKQLIKEVK